MAKEKDTAASKPTTYPAPAESDADVVTSAPEIVATPPSLIAASARLVYFVLPAPKEGQLRPAILVTDPAGTHANLVVCWDGSNDAGVNGFTGDATSWLPQIEKTDAKTRKPGCYFVA